MKAERKLIPPVPVIPPEPKVEYHLVLSEDEMEKLTDFFGNAHTGLAWDSIEGDSDAWDDHGVFSKWHYDVYDVLDQARSKK